MTTNAETLNTSLFQMRFSHIFIFVQNIYHYLKKSLLYKINFEKEYFD